MCPSDSFDIIVDEMNIATNIQRLFDVGMHKQVTQDVLISQKGQTLKDILKVGSEQVSNPNEGYGPVWKAIQGHNLALFLDLQQGPNLIKKIS